jgi:DNA-binding XRE family transcriptional regulator
MEMMMVTKKWRDLYDQLPEHRRAKIEAQLAKELEEMPLRELRRAREYSQTRLAETLNLAQSEISKIEHRTDLYLSTLRSYIEAMGGELDIIARFPDGAVRVSQFEETKEEKEEPARA